MNTVSLAPQPPLSLPAPDPGPGLARLEPEVAQIVEALSHLEQIWSVVHQFAPDDNAIEGVSAIAYHLRKALATRAAEPLGYKVEVE